MHFLTDRHATSEDMSSVSNYGAEQDYSYRFADANYGQTVDINGTRYDVIIDPMDKIYPRYISEPAGGAVQQVGYTGDGNSTSINIGVSYIVYFGGFHVGNDHNIMYKPDGDIMM